MSFIKELAGFLPTRSEQEIRDHEVWYQEYASLNEKKKEAIQKWREKKEVRNCAFVYFMFLCYDFFLFVQPVSPKRFVFFRQTKLD